MRTVPSRTIRMCVVALAVVAPSLLRAQRVTGTITGGGAPLAGATVSLLDTAHHTLARTVVGPDGRYSLSLTPAATTARVQRIGFQPREVGIPQLVGGAATLDVDMTHAATQLAAVRISNDAVCPTDASAGAGDALAVWHQVSDGLFAALVAREVRPAHMDVFRYERRLDANGEAVITERDTREAGTTNKPFRAFMPAAMFAQRGYMLEDARGRSFGMPDIDVLLDDGFIATHCLHTVRASDAAHAGEIGLAFAPVRGRDSLVDIQGTVWLDPTAPALRSLDFYYTGLEPAAVEARVGGTIHFATAANGVVFLDAWSARLPVLEEDRAPYDEARQTDTRGIPVWRQRLGRRDVKVAALQETGSLVLDATWNGALPDSVHWRADLPTLAGRITDGSTHQPLAGALAILTQRRDTVVTDSAGRYAFTPMIAGQYTVRAVDTVFSEAAAPRDRDRTIVVGRSAATADIELARRPSAAELRTTTLRGTIARAGDNTPVAGAEVWLPAFNLHATSDTTGAFVLPHAPHGRQLIEIRHVGFAVRRDTISIGGATMSRTYAIAPQGTALDTVRAVAEGRFHSPRLQAFEERRLSHAGGYFVSDSVLRANDDEQLSRVITKYIPGATFAMAGDVQRPQPALVSSRKTCTGLALLGATCGVNSGCYVAILIDGTDYWTPYMLRLQPPVYPPNLNQLAAQDWGGIEFYQSGSTLPPGMHVDDEGCGSLWLWTREK